MSLAWHLLELQFVVGLVPKPTGHVIGRLVGHLIEQEGPRHVLQVQPHRRYPGVDHPTQGRIISKADQELSGTWQEGWLKLFLGDLSCWN